VWGLNFWVQGSFGLLSLSQHHLLVWQDGKCSEARKKMIKSMKKNLGLQPYGELEAYSTTILPKEVGKLLNSREKESLDLQWAVLQATWLQLEP